MASDEQLQQQHITLQYYIHKLRTFNLSSEETQRVDTDLTGGTPHRKHVTYTLMRRFFLLKYVYKKQYGVIH